MTVTTEQTNDQPAGSRSPVSLSIPCKAEYIALCRLVAGTLGATWGLDEEFIADMKVVVTEACNCFLVEPYTCAQPDRGTDAKQSATESSPTLRVDFFPAPGAWEIVVSNPDRRRRISTSRVCDPATEGGLALTIIRALVDSVEQTDDDVEGSVIRLLKKAVAEPSLVD